MDNNCSLELCCCCLNFTISAIKTVLSLLNLSISPSNPNSPNSTQAPFPPSCDCVCATCLLLLIVFNKCLCPARNPSFANSHLSGSTFLKPCTHQPSRPFPKLGFTFNY
ncbi:hypothetical protein V8G54_007029 [Vigna mungo]|uniref:Uncharacterized protein n=1 Tax=Vigna mungo TaxID=3915 RepID=A0AAQ3P329_VIGMU